MPAFILPYMGSVKICSPALMPLWGLTSKGEEQSLQKLSTLGHTKKTQSLSEKDDGRGKYIHILFLSFSYNSTDLIQKI